MATLSEGEQAVVDIYDRIAAGWIAGHSSPGYWEDHLEWFADRLPPGGRVLEIGSGGGRDAAWFTAHGFAYTGTDVSRGLLDIARAKVPGADFRHLSPYELPGSLGVFDGAWAIASLIHVPPARMAEALEGVRASLKPGGLVVIALKPGGWPAWGMGQHADGRTWFHWQPGSYAQMMEECGFIVLDVFIRHTPSDGGRGWACLLGQRDD